MIKLSMNENWRYQKLGASGGFRKINIPHDAMLAESRRQEHPGGKNSAWFAGGNYLYEKWFEVPESYAGKDIIFEFEGVYKDAVVRLNGETIGEHLYGYTGFYVNAAPHIRYGAENVLQVTVHNADQPNSRWYSGSGIYRPVWMHIGEKKRIRLNGVKISTMNFAPAIIAVQVRTSGSGTVSLEILDKETTIATAIADSDGEVCIQLEIPNAKLWTPDNPQLYSCRVRFEQDQQEVSFGIRKVDWSAEKGLQINGKRVILRGACIHHDNGILGACAYPEAEERKIRLMQENGYNAIRSAHNPCSKSMLEACDRLGMLVMDEYVDMWYIHKTQYDYASHMEKHWQKDLRSMVDKDYNHPSVIIYSTGNEVSETAQKKGIALTKAMTEYLHKLDETRPVSCGVNIFFNLLSSIGFGVYSDKKAKQESQKSKKKKSVGSEFYNNLAGLLGDKMMKLGATLHGCDVKTRDAFANMDIAGYNYGIFRYAHDLKKYPQRLIVGSETFCSDAYTFWEMAKKHPRIIGDFVWAGMDYIGEVGVGAWEYEDYAPKDTQAVGWITAGSGRVDLVGNANAEAAYTRVAFELEVKPQIAVRPVNHTYDKHSPSAWKMSNARMSWSWDGCEGEPAVVEVYARAARVDLYVNKKKVGSKRIKKDCRTQFKTIYHRGAITAVSYDENGQEIARNTLHSAGTKTYLCAIPEKHLVQAGELCFIKLRYTDQEGRLKPLVRGTIALTVTKGELVALGSGCPFFEGSYHSDQTDTYYGEALAVIRADEDGRVEAKAMGGNCECSIMLSSKQ